MDRFAVVILILVNLSAAASLRAQEAGAPVAAADQVGQWSISPSKVSGEAIATGYPVVLDPERAEYPSVLPRFLGRGRGFFGGRGVFGG